MTQSSQIPHGSRTPSAVAAASRGGSLESRACSEAGQVQNQLRRTGIPGGAGVSPAIPLTKVAIVEDNRLIRESLEDFIHTARECRCVCLCSTAEEALKAIPRHQPDIVLMDIQLPKVSGIECTARLKQLLPSTQIIIVTVYEDTDRIFKALRAGACGYLLKCCTPEELVAAVREVRQGGAPMSREIARKVISSFQEPVAAAAEVEGLSARETDTLELLAQGYSNKQIAAQLGLTENTVRWHLWHVYNKLHVRSRTEAVLKFQSARNGCS